MFTPEECRELIARGESLGFEAASVTTSSGPQMLPNLRNNDRAIFEDADFARHVDYIHYNPVKHGLVTRVCDWPYSSFRHYVRRGVLPSDWGGDVNGGVAASYGEPT